MLERYLHYNAAFAGGVYPDRELLVRPGFGLTSMAEELGASAC